MCRIGSTISCTSCPERQRVPPGTTRLSGLPTNRLSSRVESTDHSTRFSVMKSSHPPSGTDLCRGTDGGGSGTGRPTPSLSPSRRPLDPRGNRSLSSQSFANPSFDGSHEWTPSDTKGRQRNRETQKHNETKTKRKTKKGPDCSFPLCPHI